MENSAARLRLSIPDEASDHSDAVDSDDERNICEFAAKPVSQESSR